MNKSLQYILFIAFTIAVLGSDSSSSSSSSDGGNGKYGSKKNGKNGGKYGGKNGGKYGGKKNGGGGRKLKCDCDAIISSLPPMTTSPVTTSPVTTSPVTTMMGTPPMTSPVTTGTMATGTMATGTTGTTSTTVRRRLGKYKKTNAKKTKVTYTAEQLFILCGCTLPVSTSANFTSNFTSNFTTTMIIKKKKGYKGGKWGKAQMAENENGSFGEYANNHGAEIFVVISGIIIIAIGGIAAFSWYNKQIKTKDDMSNIAEMVNSVESGRNRQHTSDGVMIETN